MVLKLLPQNLLCVSRRSPKASFETSSMSKKKLTILFIEDDTDFREALTLILEDRGYIVRSLADGRDLEEIYSKDTFDIVLLDYHLPYMTGIEIAKKLRKLSDHTFPIIMISAHENMAQTARNEGIDYFFSKPLDLEKFFRSLRSLS